jgi:hypothetical protein
MGVKSCQVPNQQLFVLRCAKSYSTVKKTGVHHGYRVGFLTTPAGAKLVKKFSSFLSCVV